MPSYTFQCESCGFIDLKIMSISSYARIKNEKIKCSECNNGVLFQQLAPINSVVERKGEDAIQQIKEDAQKIVEKVKSGDEAAILDVYGHRANPYKKV